jgi:hypothetical protein
MKFWPTSNVIIKSITVTKILSLGGGGKLPQNIKQLILGAMQTLCIVVQNARSEVNVKYKKHLQWPRKEIMVIY